MVQVEEEKSQEGSETLERRVEKTLENDQKPLHSLVRM